jgi:hypothetical protein
VADFAAKRGAVGQHPLQDIRVFKRVSCGIVGHSLCSLRGRGRPADLIL